MQPVVDQVVITGQPVKEFHGKLFLWCQSVVLWREETDDVFVSDRIVLA